MLKQFEQGDNMSAGVAKKPGVAAKPVLQRFQQMKENASSNTSEQPKPLFKPGQPGVKLVGLRDSDFHPKSRSNNSNSSNSVSSGNESNDTSRRVSVPKIFQNGQESAKDNDDNNNKNDNNTKTNGVLTESAASSNSNKPPLMPKFPKMNASNVEKPTLSSKPENTINKSSEKFNSRPALLPKNFLAKTDSVSSNSSSSSVSSSLNQITNSTPVSPTPTPSGTQPQSQDTNGVFDFKSQLRKADSSGTPGKRVLSGVNNNSSTEPVTPKSPLSPSSPTASTSTTFTQKSTASSSVPPIPTSAAAIQMRSKRDQRSQEIIERKSDGKKFRKIELPSNSSETAPQKPTLPSDIDLTSIREEYGKANSVSQHNSSDTGSVSETAQEEEDCEDLYWEGESIQPVTPVLPPKPGFDPPPPPPKPGHEMSRESARISLIPEMSAEEEGLELPLYDETPIGDDIYHDAVSERENSAKPKTSVSSESQLTTESEQDKKRRQKEEALAKKKEEKERKEKERKEKEEEKKRKKKEEEELRLRSKFNLTGQEKTVGEGVIKQDAKASGLNLKVKKGQVVTIIRLHSNPQNKWLVKSDSQVGYVDNQNIEVDPNIIRQAMAGETEEEFDQPTYDDVPEDCPPFSDLIKDDDGDADSIYEVCS